MAMKLLQIITTLYQNRLISILFRLRHTYSWLFFKPKKMPMPTREFIIITLTSFSARRTALIKTLQSLILQDEIYDFIVIWLAEQDYKQMASYLKKYEKYNVQVRLAPRDIKSYKKIFYSAQLWPKSILITADDDILYHRTWLRELLTAYTPGRKVVVGHRGSLIQSLPNGMVAEYLTWERTFKSDSPKRNIFLTSGGGNLYPPGCFSSNFFRDEIFMKVCPTADDLWQYSMLLLSGYAFQVVESTSKEIITWRGSQKQALWHTNIIHGQNDAQFREILNLFPEIEKLISDGK